MWIIFKNLLYFSLYRVGNLNIIKRRICVKSAYWRRGPTRLNSRRHSMTTCLSTFRILVYINTHFFVKMFPAVFCYLLTVVMCSYGDLELLKDDQQRTNQLLSQRLEEQNIQNLGLRYSTLLSLASCTLLSLASSGTLLSLASGT